MIKVIKNEAIGDLHCIAYDDGTFEFSCDEFFENDVAELNIDDAQNLITFLKSDLYGQVGPVFYQ